MSRISMIDGYFLLKKYAIDWIYSKKIYDWSILFFGNSKLIDIPFGKCAIDEYFLHISHDWWAFLLCFYFENMWLTDNLIRKSMD